MNICKLKPDYNTCCSCIDTQLDTGEKKDCAHCLECTWVRILSLGRTIFGRNYAFVTGPSTGWAVEKVDVKRIGLCTYVNDQDGELKLIVRHNERKNALEKAKEKEG